MKFNMPNIFSNIVIPPRVWRFVGFGSSIAGFSCYALSPSFNHLFGHWNLLKILLYSILSFFFSLLMLFLNCCPQFSRGFLSKTHVGFLVLMLTSLYSFYEDESQQQTEEKGYQSILSLVSFGAFALMSLSLSRQTRPEFDVGMSNFFLGCLIVAFMKMNITIALGVVVLLHLVITIRSYAYSLLEPPNVGDTEQTIIEIGSSVNEMQSLANTAPEETQIILVSESHSEMQSLTSYIYEESDPVDQYENGDEDMDGSIDAVETWLRAYEGTVNRSSPL